MTGFANDQADETRDPPPPDWKCPECDYPNHGEEDRCFDCGCKPGEDKREAAFDAWIERHA